MTSANPARRGKLVRLIAETAILAEQATSAGVASLMAAANERWRQTAAPLTAIELAWVRNSIEYARNGGPRRSLEAFEDVRRGE